MFGLSFGELMVLLLVSMVVLGPKELPRYLRKAGEFVGKLRRMAYDMRERSGIDEVLRSEGLDRDLAELRRLTRGELAGVVGAVRSAGRGIHVNDVLGSPYAAGTSYAPVAGAALPYEVHAAPASPGSSVASGALGHLAVDREREYPPSGADTYGALPEAAFVYEGGLPASDLAEDPVYTGQPGPSVEAALVADESPVGSGEAHS